MWIQGVQPHYGEDEYKEPAQGRAIGTGVDHDFMASISNNTTIMGCNDKERHNSIYEPRNNQQHHNGYYYYIVDKTVQHGQSVEMDMKIHLADKVTYAEERGLAEW